MTDLTPELFACCSAATRHLNALDHEDSFRNYSGLLWASSRGSLIMQMGTGIGYEGGQDEVYNHRDFQQSIP